MKIKSQTKLILLAILIAVLIVLAATWFMQRHAKFSNPVFGKTRNSMIKALKMSKAVNNDITAKFELQSQWAFFEYMDSIQPKNENALVDSRFSVLFRRYDSIKEMEYFDLSLYYTSISSIYRSYSNYYEYKAKIDKNGKVFEMTGPYLHSKYFVLGETRTPIDSSITDRQDALEVARKTIKNFDYYEISNSDINGWQTLDIDMNTKE